MKKIATVLAPALFLSTLTACAAAVSFGSDRVQERSTRSFPAASLKSFDVENVSGPVEIIASNGSSLVVESTKHGSDQAALARTHVEFQQSGSELQVRTSYDRGGWFGGRGGASVGYVVHLPARMNVAIANVSGPITVQKLDGDLRASEVSGAVRATLGRVSGSRTVRISTVSGPIDVQIAKNSDARVSAKTVSGAVHAFFPANIHKGYVGESLDGEVGGGNGSMKFSTVSGSINITAQ